MSQRITINTPDDIAAEVTKRAEKAGRSVSWTISHALADWIARTDRRRSTRSKGTRKKKAA